MNMMDTFNWTELNKETKETDEPKIGFVDPEISTCNNVNHTRAKRSKTLIPPKEYIFYVRYIYPSNFLLYLGQDYFPNSIDESGAALLQSGKYTFDNIDMYVSDTSKNGRVHFYFKSRKEWEELKNIMNEKRKSKIVAVPNKIYRYSAFNNSWQLSSSFDKSLEKDLIGCDFYFNSIRKDLNNYIKYKSFLTSIGENKSINNLLYGIPGTGKTSIIKTIATEDNYPIFIVNPNNINLIYLDSILNPQVDIGSSPMKILLFEDFDRFLIGDSVNSSMSQLLNSLDGLDDKGGVARFFTCNSTDIIFSNAALISRMNNKFKFELPTEEMFKGKLRRLFTFYTNENITPDPLKTNEFLKLVVEKSEEKKITLRPFVKYVIKYLFEEDYLDKLIGNINDLI